MPYWETKILPDLKAGKHLLISAHGNSIRALVMVLSDFTPEVIPSIEIPTGYAFSYTVQPDGSATCDVNIRGEFYGIHCVYVLYYRACASVFPTLF